MSESNGKVHPFPGSAPPQKVVLNFSKSEAMAAFFAIDRLVGDFNTTMGMLLFIGEVALAQKLADEKAKVMAIRDEFHRNDQTLVKPASMVDLPRG